MFPIISNTMDVAYIQCIALNKFFLSVATHGDESSFFFIKKLSVLISCGRTCVFRFDLRVFDLT